MSRKAMNAKERKKVNSLLYEVTRGWFRHIPLDSIFWALEQHGLKPVQEDGTPWAGFLCGAEGKTDIALQKDEKIIQEALHLRWYRHGMYYEITAYVN
ncbi:MAG: hypothetical protein DRO05_00585 [Thermoproteota archaeon]|nr:MAG: hypothetical protein DRO05_00585 [Candidatus Korarchaeota archaeon]